MATDISPSGGSPINDTKAATDQVSEYTNLDKNKAQTLVQMLKILGLSPEDLDKDRKGFQIIVNNAFEGKLENSGVPEQLIDDFMKSFSEGGFTQKLHAINELISGAAKFMQENEIKLSTLAYALLSNSNLDNVLNHNPKLAALENLSLDKAQFAAALEERDEFDMGNDFLSKGEIEALEQEIAEEIDDQKAREYAQAEADQIAEAKAVDAAYKEGKAMFEIPEREQFEGRFDFENVDVAREIVDGTYEGMEEGDKMVCVPISHDRHSIYSENGFSENHKEFKEDGSFNDFITGEETNLSGVFKIDKTVLNDLAEQSIHDNSLKATRPSPPMPTGGDKS